MYADTIEWMENPAAEYRIHPFWFWNGDMEDEQIRRQIAEMNDKGVGGFFICPRQGLKIPYLSQAWFEKVRTAAECAKGYGMHVWLYDEYPYPSGIAGGEVTLEHPEAKHTYLVHQAERVSGGTTHTMELPWARILSAKAVPVSENGEKRWEEAIDVRHTIGNYQADPLFQKAGLTAYNAKRFFTYRTIYKMIWDVPPGEWEVVVFLEKEIEDFKYYGTFVDPLNREAMAAFIRMTHEQYARYVGEFFGHTIKGMFTDEIGLLGNMPWSNQLPGYFKERTGIDLKERLTALAYADSPDAARIRYEYYQSIHLLLREAYHKQVHDWCEEHGLQYVAEVPSVRMTTQAFSHVPGGDSGHEKLGRPLEWILKRYANSLRYNPKMISSLARQLGRKRNLVECFHSVGWSMTLQDAKWMIDRLAALGANFYNFHAFFYTLDGLAQHDAPPSQFLQNPYWPYFRQLGDYTGRISRLMSEGIADIRIAVLDPTTSLWTQLGNPFHNFGYGGEDPAEKQRLERLRGDWEAIGIELLRNRRDFDHLDPELLASAELANGRLNIGDAAYEVLIIPPITNLEALAWKQIQAFAEHGGIVIALGLLPHEAIEAGSPAEREAAALFGAEGFRTQEQYWGGRGPSNENGLKPQPGWTKGKREAYFIPAFAGQNTENMPAVLLSLLELVAPSAVRLTADSDTLPFLMQSRKLTERRGVVFVSNQEGGSHSAQLCIDPQRLRGVGTEESAPVSLHFRLLNLETGQAHPVEATLREGEWALPLAFAPYQSYAVEWEANEADRETEEERPLVPPSLQLELESRGPWTMKAESDNTLRLETFRLTIGRAGEPGEDLPAYEVKAKTFIDQCDDIAGQREFPVKLRQMFGTPLKLSMDYPFACAYRTEVRIDRMPQACRMFMDTSAISGEWTLSINGHTLTRASFAKHEIYDYQNIACDILPFIQPGINEIKVNVQVEHDWDGVVDAIYLQGPFGVEWDSSGLPALTAEPESAASLPSEYSAGYPYYAGAIRYERSFEITDAHARDSFELSFPDWEQHDTVEVTVNGRALGVRSWSPYVWRGPASMLRSGSNTVEVRVTGTLIGLLEGKYFNYRDHSVDPVEGRQT
ncbi:glycosyl hydrolase [Paenibacillus doosanensis]|uniref:glycosyl hydrolase n=1 Tax=Paenibacillus doosanensis TaxID=1229154 RepID=UPI00217FDB3A|nr:glycosyl hydrolase [Paenibacillus doosanensis]MCS7464630.1 glycosyl hydrolase [Paenibacillus doosanensis]